MVSKSWKLLLSLWIGIIGTLNNTHAQLINDRFIGVGIDGAVSYTATDQPVSGFSISISHPTPIIPNFGYTTFTFHEKEALDQTFSLNTTTKVRSFEIYYHVPFPIVSLTIGGGGGVMETNTEVQDGTGALEFVNLVTPVSEGFIRIGLPFAHWFEFHIGYHAFATPDVDRTKGGTTDLSTFKTKKNYTGGLATLGFLIVLL